MAWHDFTLGRRGGPSSFAPGGPAGQQPVFEYQQTQPFHAGALSYAFDIMMWDPVYSVLGPGQAIRGLRSLQGPASVSNAYQTYVDLGGPLQGQYILQPLRTDDGGAGGV